MKLNWDDFVILGVHWKVREVKDGDPRIDDDYGKCDWTNLTIWINAGKSYSERVDSLVHEMCHVICGGRTRLDLTIEDDVRTFTSILVDSLARNEVALWE